jgi:SAM-dependent methyltransferase
VAPTAALPYLEVDRFLETMAGAQALATAFEIGLIDRLAGSPASAAELAPALGVEASGLDLLFGLLAGNGVLDLGAGGRAALSERFIAALPYRDLFEAKLDLLRVAVPDFLLGLTDLVRDERRFMAHSRMFKLFDYTRASAPGPDNAEWTRKWVRFTTALTKYEAQACLDRHDFSRYARWLDVGGNSGEFAAQVCRHHPGLQATVFDLPVVCEVGAAHLRGRPEADRIRFVAADARVDAWPAAMDLISFKSMLHDWPDREATHFLARAREALRPGGTLLIFERQRMPLAAGPLPYAALPMLLFARTFRDTGWYLARLDELGFAGVRTQHVALDTTFMIVEATAPAA